jgi:hypothetical protein
VGCMGREAEMEEQVNRVGPRVRRIFPVSSCFSRVMQVMFCSCAPIYVQALKSHLYTSFVCNDLLIVGSWFLCAAFIFCSAGVVNCTFPSQNIDHKWKWQERQSPFLTECPRRFISSS